MQKPVAFPSAVQNTTLQNVIVAMLFRTMCLHRGVGTTVAGEAFLHETFAEVAGDQGLSGVRHSTSVEPFKTATQRSKKQYKVIDAGYDVESKQKIWGSQYGHLVFDRQNESN